MAVKINSVSGVPYDYYSNLSPSPLLIVIFIICIVIYFLLFRSLGTNSASISNIMGSVGSVGSASSSSSSSISSSSSGSMRILEILAWGVFVLLVLLNGASYFFNIDITASLKNLFTATPELDIIATPGESPPGSVPLSQEQVFHVPDNVYDYENSRAICSAYGGRLATIQEMESAYKEGADWCGFGWSDGQMALYPTQYAKWEKLQTIHGHEHDCGRPGINGGFIDNPNVKFGINCFGKKPAINSEESQLMREELMYPKTKNEIKFDNKVAYWQNNLNEISISPFNHNNWSIL